MVNAKSPANDGNPEEELKEKNVVEEFENPKNDGTPFGWREGEISKDCSWNEFQKATYGSQKNKAEAYYEHTGRDKKISARAEYMGATPQKDSPTGREVIKKLYDKDPSKFTFPVEDIEGCEEYISAKTSYITDGLPKDFLESVLYDGKPLKVYDMGHKKDAVLEWNDVLRKLGEEDGKELARKWMNDPENYELQYKSDNRSAGAKMGHTENGRYKPPETDPEKIKAAKADYKKEIDEINKRDREIKEERNKIKQEERMKKKKG